MPVRRRKQKGLRGSNFALLWAVFKRHRGSEGVNNNTQKNSNSAISLLEKKSDLLIALYICFLKIIITKLSTTDKQRLCV